MSAPVKPILLFDWDGTIVDSNPFKWGGAWQQVFQDNPSAQHAIQEVLRRPQGKLYNRWELIRETLVLIGDDRCAGLDGDELRMHPQIAEYAARFAQILENGFDSMQPFPDVKETLQRLADQRYVMYVITNSLPEGVYAQIQHFGLPSFKAVYGLPKSKYENFLDIAAHEETTDPSAYVCVGDGDHDLHLAERIGCRFIGIANEYNGWQHDPVPFPIIRSLQELQDIL